MAHNIHLPIPVALTLYGMSAAIALLLAGQGAWIVLGASLDPRARETARWLALTLLRGGVVVFGTGVATARAFHFGRPEVGFPVTVISVLAVKALAVAAAWYCATRRNAGDQALTTSLTRGTTIPNL